MSPLFCCWRAMVKYLLLLNKIILCYIIGFIMPLYDFKDTVTGEIETKLMSMSSREEFLEQNPHIKQVITSAPALVSGTSTTNKDAGWNENLSRIAAAHQNTALADKVGGRTVKQAKINQIAKKHQTRVKDSDTT